LSRLTKSARRLTLLSLTKASESSAVVGRSRVTEQSAGLGLVVVSEVETTGCCSCWLTGIKAEASGLLLLGLGPKQASGLGGLLSSLSKESSWLGCAEQTASLLLGVVLAEESTGGRWLLTEESASLLLLLLLWLTENIVGALLGVLAEEATGGWLTESAASLTGLLLSESAESTACSRTCIAGFASLLIILNAQLLEGDILVCGHAADRLVREIRSCVVVVLLGDHVGCIGRLTGALRGHGSGCARCAEDTCALSSTESVRLRLLSSKQAGGPRRFGTEGSSGSSVTEEATCLRLRRLHGCPTCSKVESTSSCVVGRTEGAKGRRFGLLGSKESAACRSVVGVRVVRAKRESGWLRSTEETSAGSWLLALLLLRAKSEAGLRWLRCAKGTWLTRLLLSRLLLLLLRTEAAEAASRTTAEHGFTICARVEGGCTKSKQKEGER